MKPLVEVKNLKKTFSTGSGFFFSRQQKVQAVSDVSFEIKKGETLGLVGESGCGKSTLGRCVIRLLEPTSGSVVFDGQDILKLSKEKLRQLRRRMQIIFQDPYASLNPRMTVGTIISEPLKIHKLCESKQDLRDRVFELLELVGLRKEVFDKYPHEFSGGQRQRVGIARALAVNPDLVVCDEPVSALDVSIQAQVINLLMDLQQKLGLTYLFIAHDLKVVEHISTRVAVMYLGKIVEIASAEEVYQNPQHPYTQALLSAIPVPRVGAKKKRIILTGEIPNATQPPPGCHFHPRCPIAEPQCTFTVPELRATAAEHGTRCLLVK